jgi:hypothetical protein
MQNIEDFQDNYNIDLDDENEENFPGLYDILIDYTIANQGEIDLVCAINGQNMQSLLDILYVKTGLRSIEQLLTDLTQE